MENIVLILKVLVTIYGVLIFIAIVYLCFKEILRDIDEDFDNDHTEPNV